MSNQADLIHGPVRIDALGKVTITSRSDSGMYLNADGKLADLVLSSGGQASLEAGEAIVSLNGMSPVGAKIEIAAGMLGQIRHAVGPPVVGPRIEMTPTSIELAVGPPGVGTSIELTATGITLKMGVVSLDLNPVGLMLKAAETQLNVLVAGLMTKAPIKQEKIDGASVTQSTLSTAKCDALNVSKAGLEMHG